jgi:predicted NBD/HSP70 family sugar kinase
MSDKRAVLPGRSRARALYVELVRRGRARTRRELSEITGLSRSVVAQVVADLVSEGLLVEHEVEAGTVERRPRGRPSTVLAVAPRSGVAAGLDLSHRRVSIIVGDLLGAVLLEEEWPFGVDAGAHESLTFAEQRLRAALTAHGIPLKDLTSVVVSLPFPVVGDGELVQPLGEMPGWRDVRPQRVLRFPRHVAVHIENDAGVGAWGELVHTADPGLRNLLYAKVGDGLGAGLVLDGEIFAGSNQMVGEVGHVVAPGCDLTCRCGRVGCMDALVSAAAAGDAGPRAVHEAGRALGSLLAQIAGFIDPDVVVVGGELPAKSPPFFDAVRSAFAAQSVRHQSVSLRVAALGLRAERCGALDRAVELAWTGGIRAGVGRISSVY